MQSQTVTKSRDWAVALDDARPASRPPGWIGLSMAVAGGVALLAVAAGLMAPPAPSRHPTTGRPAASLGAPTLSAAAQPLQVLAASPATVAMAPPAAASAPRLETDPTATLAQAVPQRVPLARDQRDPAALARLEAAATAAPPAPAAARGEPARARVGDSDLGLRLMPGSRALPDTGRRVPDGAGGEAVALSLSASGTLDSAVQFYRQQWLADGLPADAVQVLRPGDGQVLLRAPSPQGGEHTVWIVQNGPALDIVLARVRPGPAAQR